MTEATSHHREPHAVRRSHIQRSTKKALRALLHPQHHGQSWDRVRSQRFSWLHCILSVCSYLLMVSDVPRAGLGSHDLSFYRQIEPQQFIPFGPFAYPVTKQLLQNATTTTRFWPYKYDSTSVAMRSVATHLKIPEWPVCVLYADQCDERTGIPAATLFKMIDSLVDRVQTHRDTQGHTGRITLRTQNQWSDRLHNYVFPWFFPSTKLRTIHATHFKEDSLKVSLCSSSSARHARPLTCGESLTRFSSVCGHPSCRDVANIHTHAPARLDKLLAKYPNYTMDFLLLEGVDDFSRSSLSSQGYKNVDVVTLARIRKCTTATQCETVLVDDFRYEVVSFVANVREWFFVTATLRSIGQLYAWIRLIFLVVGVHFARAHELRTQQKSFFHRAKQTLRTVVMLPSQVMVYGSLFPISCYLLAHLIDAAAVYEMMAVKFTTVMGVMALEFWELLRICAVSMRSLWLLAFVCHVVHRVATHCAWSPLHGVPGVPEFSLSFVASLTILAQMRYPWLRDARILSVHELVPSLTRYQCNSLQADTSRGFVYKLVFGTLVDYKCLAVSVFLYLGVVLLLRLVRYCIPEYFKYQALLFTQTTVPYSAGSLWPRSALVVSWNGTVLARPPQSMQPHKTTASTSPTPVSGRLQSFNNVLLAIGMRRIAIQPTQQSHASEPLATAIRSLYQYPLPTSHDIETMIMLMNLAVMTDPLTWLRLRVLRGNRICIYTGPQCTLLLPLGLSTAMVDLPIDWSELKLQLVVFTNELDWCDLLRCG